MMLNFVTKISPESFNCLQTVFKNPISNAKKVSLGHKIDQLGIRYSEYQKLKTIAFPIKTMQ